jgi:hypothetical protein
VIWPDEGPDLAAEGWTGRTTGPQPRWAFREEADQNPRGQGPLTRVADGRVEMHVAESGARIALAG